MLIHEATLLMEDLMGGGTREKKQLRGRRFGASRSRSSPPAGAVWKISGNEALWMKELRLKY